jgi:hypothetical protein
MALINNQPSLDALGGTKPQHRYPDSLGRPPFEKWILFQVKKANHINRAVGPVAAGADVDETIASVALYLPPEALTSALSASYSSSGYGVLGGAMIDAAVQAGTNLSNLIQGEQSVTAAALDLVRTQSGNLGKAILIKEGQAIATTLGLNDQMQQNLLGTFTSQTLNPRVDLFYQSTGYRQHNMQFTLIPRNKAEADSIDQILNVFQEHMLADYGGNFRDSNTPTFIGYPYEFDITMFTSTHINTIDRSVLESISINHASGTRVAFVDSRGESEYYPASTTIQLSFKETRIQGRNNPTGWKRGKLTTGAATTEVF